MSIYSPLANQIAAWLVISAIMACTGYRAFWTAWVVRETVPFARKHITQMDRFRMVVLGWLLTLPAIITLANFGPTDVIRTCKLLIGADPVFGWAVTASALFGSIGIVFGFAAAYSVFMNPSKFWRRTRAGQYILTTDRYRGLKHPIAVAWIRSHRAESQAYYDEMTLAQIKDGANLHARIRTNSDIPDDWRVYGG